ncbi:methyltransferase domain-containing protein [Aureisphaera galaxeae]|uniref:class I SAM-dependent methyltransferase n=1 Tax=Aureisphaera galaxeae TaxID=1538023 RepID=UPI002350174C|nr:methyltransferase domain-containing protein [Aureisphaera galaxeae]MDC8003418.1 methyltransferase domain-containing protein [Aureisphaera galaxeae]
MKEKNAYILGTDAQELHRLGIQHQIWAEEAQKGWRLANFKAGQTLLDLGCGPGFCTKEMAYLAGEEGRVIGVDKSEGYIEHLKHISELYHLNITPLLADFNEMQLEPNSLDGMYCRWAMAWLPNPKEILKKVYDALKPGGRMVIHEYYDWSTHQTEPELPGLKKAITAALKSFKDSPAEIDIGRELPTTLSNMGMKINNLRLMSKLATPDNVTWQWPKTFYYSYFPRIKEMGFLNEEDVQLALQEVNILENTPGATLCCPIMIEVIAEK